MSKIVFATLGSMGDVRPLAALATAASEAGHRVVFATSASFEVVVTGCGLEYTKFGSDGYFESLDTRSDLLDPQFGFAHFMNHSNLKQLELQFHELIEGAKDAEALVSTPFVAVAHLVAQSLNIPLINCICSPGTIAPQAMIGTNDPFRKEWRLRLNELRRKIGLSPVSFPQMGRFQASLNLGLYPRCLGGLIENLLVKPIDVGYPAYNSVEKHLDRELDDWLSMGPFGLITFGSFVDKEAQYHLDCAVAACRATQLNCLFVSPFGAGYLINPGGEFVRIERFVDHAQIMSRASVVVHHGGTGTLAASLQAMQPMVVVPFGLDQTFNAERVRMADLGEVLGFDQVDASSLTAAVKRALSQHARRRKSIIAEIEYLDASVSLRAVGEIEALLARRS